jgi:hypothetical protein
MNQDEVFQVVRKKIKTFDFALPGSKKVYHVPLLKDLPMDETMQITGTASDGDVTMLNIKATSFIYDLFSKRAPDVGKLTQEEFGDLFHAYQEASGATVGESAASSD